MKQLVCYCFGYSEEDIIRDLEENRGRSAILEKITAAKSSGGCHCETNHPEHR